MVIGIQVHILMLGLSSALALLTEIYSICDNDDFWVPCSASLDAQNLTQQSTYNCCKRKNLLQVDEMTTKLAVEGSAWGREPAVLNR